MQIKAQRRRGTKIERLNLYLTAETMAQVERVAEMRGVENGAAARELLEERIGQLMGSPKTTREQVPA